MSKGIVIAMLLLIQALPVLPAEEEKEKTTTLGEVMKKHYHLIGGPYVLPRNMPEVKVNLQYYANPGAELYLADAFNQANLTVLPLKGSKTNRDAPEFGVLKGRPLAIDRGVILVIDSIRLEKNFGNVFRLEGEVLTSADNQFKWYQPLLKLKLGRNGRREMVNFESPRLEGAPVYPQGGVRRFKVHAEFLGSGQTERLEFVTFTFSCANRVSGEDINPEFHFRVIDLTKVSSK